MISSFHISFFYHAQCFYVGSRPCLFGVWDCIPSLLFCIVMFACSTISTLLRSSLPVGSYQKKHPFLTKNNVSCSNIVIALILHHHHVLPSQCHNYSGQSTSTRPLLLLPLSQTSCLEMRDRIQCLSKTIIHHNHTIISRQTICLLHIS